MYVPRYFAVGVKHVFGSMYCGQYRYVLNLLPESSNVPVAGQAHFLATFPPKRNVDSREAMWQLE